MAYDLGLTTQAVAHVYSILFDMQFRSTGKTKQVLLQCGIYRSSETREHCFERLGCLETKTKRFADSAQPRAATRGLDYKLNGLPNKKRAKVEIAPWQLWMAS